jgi:mono/diheme cytochrome c family protein
VLKAAGTTGMVGPNLDHSTMKQAAMVSVIANGTGTMQSYAGALTGTQIQDVATFVVTSRTG